MKQCIFSAQGDFSCPTKAPAAAVPHHETHEQQHHTREAFGPAWVDAAAKKGYWAERSGGGFPLPATEWQDRAHESHGWVAGAEGFSVAAPVMVQQAGSPPASCGSPGMAPCPAGQQCLNGRCAVAPSPIASATVAKR